jgi:hypothetical protein
MEAGVFGACDVAGADIPRDPVPNPGGSSVAFPPAHRDRIPRAGGIRGLQSA